MGKYGQCTREHTAWEAHSFVCVLFLLVKSFTKQHLFYVQVVYVQAWVEWLMERATLQQR